MLEPAGASQGTPEPAVSLGVVMKQLSRLLGVVVLTC